MVRNPMELRIGRLHGLSRVNRNFTYSTLVDALTGYTQNVDSRSNFTYTFYNAASGQTTNTVYVSALLVPSLQVVTYTVTCYANTPWLTQNPNSAGGASVFSAIHLLKNRAWDTNNNQIIVAEGIGSPGQIFFLKIGRAHV